MGESFTAKLFVSKESVELNEFVERFLSRVVVGVVTSLRDVEKVKDVRIHIEDDNVDVEVNGQDISLNPFTNDIVAGTVTGLVTTLKEADKLENLDISIGVQE